jgi:hypothetical protein
MAGIAGFLFLRLPSHASGKRSQEAADETS